MLELLHHIAELDPIGDEEQDGEEHCQCVGDGCCPRDTLRACGVVQDDHERNVKAALSEEGEDHRLELSARRLEDGDDHHGDGDRGAGDGDGFQEILSVSDGFRIVNEEADERRCAEVQKERTRNGNDERIEERRFDDLAHTLEVLGGEVVADQRQNALCHTVGDGECENIDLLCDTHAGDRLIGIRNDHFVENEVGCRTHQQHNEAGEADEKDLLGDTVRYGEIFEGEIDDGDVLSLLKQAEEVDNGDRIGEHGGNCRALDAETERKDEDRVKNDIGNTAERKTDAGFLGIALCAHEMGKTRVQNGGNAADGDRPEEIIGAVAVGELVRSEEREDRGTRPIEGKTVNERKCGSAPNTERGTFLGFFAVAFAEASGDQTRAADAEEVGDTRQHDEGWHGEGCGGNLIGVVHLTDEEGVRHVIDHGDDLADDGWDNEGNDRFRDGHLLE